jgi:hypothetical protein
VVAPSGTRDQISERREPLQDVGKKDGGSRNAQTLIIIADWPTSEAALPYWDGSTLRTKANEMMRE